MSKFKKSKEGWERLTKLFTVNKWIEDYNLNKLRHDLQAGITVGIMLIPQSMAYAVIAGMPPIYGLYACILPLLVYPLFGTSRHLAMGTVAIDMIIISAGISQIAQPKTEEYIVLVTLLAFIVGVFQIIMFSAKLGYLVNYLSRPVIVGFTMAASIIIITGQLGNLVGVELGQSVYFYETLAKAFSNLQNINQLALGIGIGSIIVIGLLNYWKPLFPSSLLIIILGIAGSWYFNLPQKGIDVIGEIPAGLPSLTLPSLTIGNLRELISTAIALSLVQFMTIVTLGKTYALRNDYEINSNQELFALGISNFLNGFFSAMPVSGSFSRSAVNEQSKSKTPLSNAVAAGVIILSLLFLTPLFYYLPYPSLAAVVIVAGYGLIDIRSFKFLFQTKKRDCAIASFTLFITLFVGIQEGVLLGIIASLLGILYRESYPNIAELGHLPGTRSFKDLDRFSNAEPLDKILIVRLDASFSFANAEYFKDYILDKSKGKRKNIDAVIIDGTPINDLDTTALNSISSIIQTLQERDIELYIAGVKGPVRDVMKRAGLYKNLGPQQRIFRTTHRAVVHILKRWGKNESDDDRLDKYYDYVEEEPDEEKLEADSGPEEPIEPDTIDEDNEHFFSDENENNED